MNLKIRDMMGIGLGAALMGVFSQLSIPLPFTSVPLTLQAFGVVILSIILGKRNGTLALIIFTLVGAIGIPVFANFRGGPSVIVGPTGGYIFGFIAMAYIIGIFLNKDNKILLFIGAYLGLAAEYIFGMIQLKLVLGLTIEQTLISGFYPYIIKDIIFIALGVMIGVVIRDRVKK